ncbi:glycerol ethanol, ferric requiring protein [Blastocladiella emersonii ATCC 22665]|nr:glycerol ethanol, ferric requiring protein [Blastocladiella emersonii ATCC 22665]
MYPLPANAHGRSRGGTSASVATAAASNAIGPASAAAAMSPSTVPLTALPGRSPSIGAPTPKLPPLPTWGASTDAPAVLPYTAAIDIAGSPATTARQSPLPTRPSSPTGGMRAQLEDAVLHDDHGQRRYDDFSTLDWMHHLTRSRHRDAAAASAGGPGRRRHGGGGDHPAAWWEDIQSWAAVTIIGVLVGAVAAWLDVVLEWAADLRSGTCATYPYLSQKKCCWEQWDAAGSCADWHEWSFKLLGLRAFFPINFFFYVAFAVLFAATAATLVVHHAPEHAALSGIPEVKTILGGFVMNRVLSLRTGIVKFLGLVFSVASGLSVGNKAPLVHIAACVGHAVTRLFPRFRNDPAVTTYLLSSASAAGIAVAFGSPIGGILYALEEVSTFFPLQVMGMSFFCCLMATLTLQAFDPFKTGTMVMFQVSHNREWHLFELVPFTLLAVVGGFIGAFFNRWNVRIQLARERSVFCQQHPVREVMFLALVTAVVGYWTSFSRGQMLSLLGGLFRECKDENYHGMCDNETLVWTCFLLLFTMAMRFSTAVVTYGSKVPGGAFVPGMLVGACFGRVLGIVVNAFQNSFADWPIFAACQVADRVCVTPGSYALLGAAAALTGVTRLTISIVVILFELTGALNFVLPTIMTVVIAKFVADMCGGSQNGLAKLWIQLKAYPYMDTKDTPHLAFTAEDVMCAADQLVILRNGMPLAHVQQVVRSVKYSTFPIVDDFASMGLEGCITRSDLQYAIATSPAANAANAMSLPIYFHSPVPRLHAGAGATPSSSSFTSSGVHPGFIDVRAFTDSTPLSIPPQTNGSLIHSLFATLGLRYVFVKRAGALAGLITKKDMIRATTLAQGGFLGIDQERDRAPNLDPLIDHHGQRLRRRLRWGTRDGGDGGAGAGLWSRPISPTAWFEAAAGAAAGTTSPVAWTARAAQWTRDTVARLRTGGPATAMGLSGSPVYRAAAVSDDGDQGDGAPMQVLNSGGSYPSQHGNPGSPEQDWADDVPGAAAAAPAFLERGRRGSASTAVAGASPARPRSTSRARRGGAGGAGGGGGGD